MSAPERHYSTFELDIAWAEGLAAHPELEAHLASCAECAAYIDELRAFDAVPAPSLRNVSSRRVLPRKWLAPAAATLALAAALFLFVRGRSTRSEEEGGYVGVKSGTPAAMLLLKRGDVTRPWDSREPVHPADVIAVHVVCSGYRDVSIMAKEGARWVRAAEAACPSEPGVLPFTLVVDGRPGDEELGVVFTTAKTDESAVTAAVASELSPPQTWVIRFVLPKEPSR